MTVRRNEPLPVEGRAIDAEDLEASGLVRALARVYGKAESRVLLDETVRAERRLGGMMSVLLVSSRES